MDWWKEHLLSLCCGDFQWKARAAHEVYIIIEDATQVDKVINIVSFHGVAYFFLQAVNSEIQIYFPVLLYPLTWSFVNGLLGFAGVVCFFFAFFPFTSSLLRLDISLRLFGALRPLLLRRLILAEFSSSNCDSSSSSSSSSAASSDVKLLSERLTAKLRLLSYRLAVKWSSSLFYSS